MNKVHLSATVKEDGSLTIPAFAMRGLGYRPGSKVDVTMPGDPCLDPDCARELHLIPRCAGQDPIECGDDEDRLSIPKQFLKEANIPDGQGITVMAADGVLLVVTMRDELEDLPVELCALLNELGVSPLSVRGLWEEEWPWM